MAAIAWDHPSPHVIDVEVGPDDIDELNHANNVAYLRWLERVAWSHSAAVGLDWAAYERLGVACVVRRHELDYLMAAFEGEHLKAATWVIENDGRASMWRGYQIARPEDGRTLLRARSKFACLKLETGRVCRMPPEFVAAYQVETSPE